MFYKLCRDENNKFNGQAKVNDGALADTHKFTQAVKEAYDTIAKADLKVKKAKELKDQVKDKEKELWGLAKDSFLKMYKAQLSDVAASCMQALANKGLVLDPVTNKSQVIDLKSMASRITCEAASTSDVLAIPSAYALKAAMTPALQKGADVFNMLKVALAQEIPQVRALLDAKAPSDADVQRCMTTLEKDPETWSDLFSIEIALLVQEKLRPIFTEMLDERAAMVLDQALALVDSCLAGVGGMRMEQVDELHDRMSLRL